jgi:hypothetical protein
MSMPDSSVATTSGTQSHPNAFHGKVMGGHAPVIGAEVYVLQVGEGGYDSASTNTMNKGEAGTDPTLGNYVLTGAGGAFNISGDYTCTANEPVYVAASGGTSTAGASLITITNSTVPNNGLKGNKETFGAITFTATGIPSGLTSVSFASGAFLATGKDASPYAVLNGTTQMVTASTPTTFTIANTTTPIEVDGAAGMALTGGAPNPAIINLAVLGVCPAAGNKNFGNGSTDPISFVFIDEVSTTAAAYALNAFGSGPFTIGAPAGNLLGIQNAANNAAQLYDIQDSSSGMALANTPAGNGVVPQATLNTLGNILSACVDSSNTAIATSDSCGTLFSTATGTGGTVPTDIATAMFNIAANPAGAAAGSTTYVTTLHNLQASSPEPYSPNLSSAPNDFGVAITYPASLNAHVTDAESIAVDGNGQIWTTAQGDTSITLWSPLGTVVNPSPTGNSNGYIFGYVSVDTANNAWTGNADDAAGPPIEQFSDLGTLANTFTNNNGTGFKSAYTVIATQGTDNNDPDAYFFEGTTTQQIEESTPNGGGVFGGLQGPFNVETPPAAQVFISHGSIDSAGDLWLTSEAGEQILRVEPTITSVDFGPFHLGDLFSGLTMVKNFPIHTPTITGAAFQPQPEFPAIDAANDAWIPIQTTASETGSATPTPGLEKISDTGAVTEYFSGTGANSTTQIFTGANFYQSFGAAVDGNGNIWVTNRLNAGLGGTAGAPGSSTLIELNGTTGAAISPSTNYTLGGILDDCLNLAIDPSGDIWMTNFTGNQLVEVIGAAGPVTTPLSTAAINKVIGKEPQ